MKKKFRIKFKKCTAFIFKDGDSQHAIGLTFKKEQHVTKEEMALKLSNYLPKMINGDRDTFVVLVPANEDRLGFMYSWRHIENLSSIETATTDILKPSSCKKGTVYFKT